MSGTWLGPVRTASGGMLRHKVQAVVIGAVLLVATASATLGIALLSASDGPFTHAFAAQRGADVTITANAARATTAELAATGRVSGVTAAAGPFAETTVRSQYLGGPFGQLTLAARSAPGGPVDDLVLDAGHWVTGPGQVVLNGNPGGGGPGVGSTVTITSAPGKPVLTIVGFANSITNTADGWVAPAEVAALRAPGTPPAAQMLYRFADAGGYSQVRADVTAITRALPAGAVAGSGSWLTAQYQRIGVLKSLGLSPSQVIAVYLSRVGWPALAGCLAGVVLGDFLAASVLKRSAGAYGVGSQQVPWFALLVAPAGMFALTMLAAFGPALRAGRLSAIDAIAAGRAPRAGRGYAVHRLMARLNLPRPVGLGVAAPFSRPARTLATLAAVAFGATAVIFAVGLNSSLSRAAADQSLSATVPVQIQEDGYSAGPGGGPSQPTAAQFADVTTALRAQPGTAHYVMLYGNGVTVPGVSQSVQALAFDGASAWTGYGLISGHRYDAPGQIDVNTMFLDASGLAVGDTATVDTGTAQVTGEGA